MEIIKLTEEKYQEWDKFCLESDDAWFWHTSYYLHYQLSNKLASFIKNESFFIKGDDGKISAICPLIIEEKEGNRIFSCGKDYSPNPCFAKTISAKEKEKALNYIFTYIDGLAQINDLKYYMVRISNLSKNSLVNKYYYNYLLNRGFMISNGNTSIVDTSKPLIDILSSFKHGHRQNIKKYENILSADILDKNCSWDEFLKYKKMHHLASGRITRSEETFRIMHDWIQGGVAFLSRVKKNEKEVGYFLFTIYKNRVYYSSSATDPEFISLPIGHTAIWEAIKHMKKIGVEYFELGWQEYTDTIFKKISDKEKNLSYFKNGFGGFSQTVFQGIKFFDKNIIPSILNLDF